MVVPRRSLFKGVFRTHYYARTIDDAKERLGPRIDEKAIPGLLRRIESLAHQPSLAAFFIARSRINFHKR